MVYQKYHTAKEIKDRLTNNRVDGFGVLALSLSTKFASYMDKKDKTGPEKNIKK